MKKILKSILFLTSLIIIAVSALLIQSCDSNSSSSTNNTSCEHVFEEATCTNPKTCTLCHKTFGEPLDHQYVDDHDCTTPLICSVCKQVLVEAKEHTFSSDWKQDEKQHWHECECGSKANIENHTYDENVCSVCGHEHTHHIIQKEIHLEDYGCCFGHVTIHCCDSCDYKYMDEKDQKELYMLCDYKEEDSTQETKEENGVQVMYATQKCFKCHTTLSYKLSYSTTNCITTLHQSVKLTKDDEVIIDNLMIESTGYESHEYVEDALKLSTYSSCGGEISYYKCKNCDEVLYMTRYDVKCNLSEPVESQETDKNGWVHDKSISTCNQCGLKYVTDHYIEVISSCESINHNVQYIMQDDKVIFTLDSNYSQEKHQYQYEIIHLDKTCENGVVKKKTCSVCNDYAYTTNFSHQTNNIKTIDFKDYNAIGSIKVLQCPCKEVTEVQFDYENAITKDEYYVNEDNIACEKHTFTFQDSSLSIIIDSYQLKEGCSTYYYATYTVKNDSNILLDNIKTRQLAQTDHDYSIECILEGSSCEDGVKVIKTCNNCHKEEIEYYNYHKLTSLYHINLEDYGVDYGYIDISECLCKQKQEVYSYLGCLNHSEIETTIDKEPHTIHTYTSNDGKLVVTVDSQPITSGCAVYSHNTISVKYGNTILIDNYRYMGETTFNHDYEYHIELNGDSCEDGYKMIGICSKCQDKVESEGWWHTEILIKKIDFTNYGAEGYMIVYECPCKQFCSVDINCGANTEEYSQYVDENNIEHDVYTYRFNGSEFKMIQDFYYIIDGCAAKQCIDYQFINGSKTIDTYHYIPSISYNHEFIYEYVLKGESCEDGYDVYGECSLCHETMHEEYYEHDKYVIKEEDLSKYGVYGNYQILQCLCKKENSVEFYTQNNKYNYSTITDEQGIEHDITTITHEDSDLIIVEDSYKIQNGCKIQSFYRFSIKNNEGYILEPFEYIEYEEEYHDLEETIELLGDSCEDGIRYIITCKNCDYQESFEMNHHYANSIKEIDFSSYGVNGSFVINECPCKELVYVDLLYYCENNNYESYVDENNISHSINTQTFKDSELVIIEDSYTIIEDDVYKNYKSYTIKNGDDILLDNYNFLYKINR